MLIGHHIFNFQFSIVMNLEWYIAHRLLRGDGTKSVSVPIVRIAIVDCFGVVRDVIVVVYYHWF